MSDSNTPLDTFFSDYNSTGIYKYNKKSEINTEFRRLCRAYGWNNVERDNVRLEFRRALVEQFNDDYGTDENDLDAWKSLCEIIGIDPIPESLKKCQKAVRETHVNLVDLMDSQRTGEAVHKHDSEDELSEYTIETGKYFPKEEAYEGGLLRFLLRHIRSGGRSGGSTSGGGWARGRGENRGGRGRGRGGNRGGGRGGGLVEGGSGGHGEGSGRGRGGGRGGGPGEGGSNGQGERSSRGRGQGRGGGRREGGGGGHGEGRGRGRGGGRGGNRGGGEVPARARGRGRGLITSET